MTQNEIAVPDYCRVTPEGFVWLLSAACQLHRLPFNAASLLNNFPLPHTLTALKQALNNFGFSSSVETIGTADLHQLTLPCFVLVPAAANQALAEASAASGTGATQSKQSVTEVLTDFVLLLKAEGDRIVYLAPEESEPRETSAPSFLASCLGWGLQIGRTDQPAVSRDTRSEKTAERQTLSAATPIRASVDTSQQQRQPSQQNWDQTSTLPEDPNVAEPPHSTPATHSKEKKRENKVRWFASEMRKHHTVWRTVLLISLITQAIGLAAPLFARLIIDQVIIEQSGSTLVIIGFALTFFIVFTAVINWLRHYLVLQTGRRIATAIGQRVVNHLLRLPLSYFESRSTGTLLSRMQGIETMQRITASAAFTVIFDLPFLLFFVTAMFWLSWKLTLLSLLAVALIVLLSISMMPLFRDHLNRQFLLGARNQAFLAEYLASMVTVKTLQMEQHIEKRYSDHLASYLAVGLSSRQAANSYLIVCQALEQTMMLTVLIAGTTMLMDNAGFSIGMFVAFQMLASRIGEPLLRLVGLWRDIQQIEIANDRIGEIFDQSTERFALSTPQSLAIPARLDVVDLAFRYSAEHRWLFRHLDLTLPAGHITAIIGPSGGGKTTLGRLMQGLYSPQHGQILLDNNDIQGLPANELRNNFSIVSLDTTLFAGTIYDNLVASHPQASFDEVIRACKSAGIHDTIDQLPDGYRTEIGEQGTGLSGGQRQRLAFARAILRQPRILIIDEGLSSLDQAAAEKIYKTINGLKGSVTVLYFGHQLPSGLQADKLIDLGRVLEIKFNVMAAAPAV